MKKFGINSTACLLVSFAGCGWLPPCTANEQPIMQYDESLKAGNLAVRAALVWDDAQAHKLYASGLVTVRIQNQQAKLQADQIEYDKVSRVFSARGNVVIERNGFLTSGDSFKFRIESDEYLVTENVGASPKVQPIFLPKTDFFNGDFIRTPRADSIT